MAETSHLAAPVGAFDGNDPPDWESILDCVHCGICLPACPTYRVLGQEMDSPRGRLYLMRAAGEGRIGLTENFVTHMDRCLGCRGCESVCPSGIPFGRLLEQVRGQIERQVERPLGRRLLGRLVLGTFPERRRLARMLGLLRLYQSSGLQRLVRGARVLAPFPRLAAMERLLPRIDAASGATLPARLDPAGPSRGTVALLGGCVQALLFPEVNAASARLLARAGYTVVTPPAQGCCGALHLHWGDRDAARRLARANVAAFAGADRIVTNAAGCGTALRDYGHLLPDDPAAAAVAGRVRDVTELLADALPEPRHPIELTVTYHEPCHLAHGQRVREAPRTLLRAIPGLRLVELAESDLCCGSAGVYNLLEPEIAGRLLGKKLDRIAETGADVVVSGNPGCLLQLRMGLAERGLAIRAHHPVELLDWSVEGEDAAVEVIRLHDRVAFQDGKMARHRLAATGRCQADLYCLAPGQRQAPHSHADQDKLYLGVEGVGRIRIGDEEAALEPGTLVVAPAGVEHGLANESAAPLLVFVVVVPPPPHA